MRSVSSRFSPTHHLRGLEPTRRRGLRFFVSPHGPREMRCSGRARRKKVASLKEGPVRPRTLFRAALLQRPLRFVWVTRTSGQQDSLQLCGLRPASHAAHHAGTSSARCPLKSELRTLLAMRGTDLNCD